MAKGKSILDKFTDTMKGLADSASQALKAEEPARVDETNAAYMPFAAEGLVSDPLLLPPIATQPARRKKRAARKTARRSAGKAPRKSAGKKSARVRSGAVASKSASKTSRKTAKRGSAVRTVRKKGR